MAFVASFQFWKAKMNDAVTTVGVYCVMQVRVVSCILEFYFSWVVNHLYNLVFLFLFWQNQHLSGFGLMLPVLTLCYKTFNHCSISANNNKRGRVHVQPCGFCGYKTGVHANLHIVCTVTPLMFRLKYQLYLSVCQIILSKCVFLAFFSSLKITYFDPCLLTLLFIQNLFPLKKNRVHY